jgi:hypothetical protein
MQYLGSLLQLSLFALLVVRIAANFILRNWIALNAVSACFFASDRTLKIAPPPMVPIVKFE